MTRAVFSDGRLWLLSDAGGLSSIAESGKARVRENLPEPVLDLFLLDGHPAVISCEREDSESWTLRRRIEGDWSVEATVPRKGDDLIGAGGAAGKVLLLTSRRIIEVGSDRPSAVHLSGQPLACGIASVHLTAEQVFVGINCGEWGGGLRRIDRRSGKVAVIEHNATGELCGGPLNTKCDPVNGIASVPWKTDCVVVAVGLVHRSPHGRLVEVCADKVRRLYYKPFREEEVGTTGKQGDEPFETVAFFGLTRSGDSLWAAGIDGLYHIEAGGKVEFTPLPEFKEIGDIKVSFDLPHLVLVLTNVNQRRSLSGSVPMLVPR